MKTEGQWGGERNVEKKREKNVEKEREKKRDFLFMESRGKGHRCPTWLLKIIKVHEAGFPGSIQSIIIQQDKSLFWTDLQSIQVCLMDTNNPAINLHLSYLPSINRVIFGRPMVLCTS